MLIGICGKAGAGKDTVAEQILRHDNFVRLSFADPIKQMLSILGVNCMNRETKEVPDDRFGVSPRRMAQTLGTEWGRNLIDQDIWLKIAQERWRELKYSNTNLVIPDVRFPNELAWIRKEGYVIHVTRDVAPVEEHSSENSIDINLEWDSWLENNGTIAELHAEVNKLMENLLNAEQESK